LGQSRNDSIDARIKRAAICTLVEDRLAGLNVHAISSRAGVAEAEFYDRWPDDWTALLAALDDQWRLPVLPDTGSLLADLVAYARGIRLRHDDPDYAAALYYLMGEWRADPGLWEKFRPDFEDRRRRALVMIERAVARGELPASVDGNDIMNGILALAISWLGKPQVPEEREARLAVEQVLGSLQGASARPRRRDAVTSSADAYTLYLFNAASDAGGRRVAQTQVIECSPEGEAIAGAEAYRRGRYAELWKQGRIVRIFEPEE
jgi:hypothetical protein